MRIPCEASQKWYQSSHEDVNESTHGTILIGVVSQIAGVQGSVGVAVQLDWTVEFEGTNVPSTSAQKRTITPDTGYSNLFTTSDGSYSSSVLTFKMHAGGTMVPFTAAEPHLVYKSAAGTKVKYFNEAGAELECNWFAKMQDNVGLLLFASKEKALAYVKSGDLSEALVYYKQGNYTTPAVPKFEAVSVSSILEEGRDAAARTLRTLTADPAAISLLSRLLANLNARPTGSLDDPVKVFVEDPVPVAQGRDVCGLLEDALSRS